MSWRSFFSITAMASEQKMWREEVGITEMLLAYIGEFVEFQGWLSWRNVVVDILSCHEEVRRRRVAEMNLSLGGTVAQTEFKIEPVEVSQSQESTDRPEVKASCVSERIGHDKHPEHGYTSSIVVIEDDDDEEDVKELMQESMGVSAETEYGVDSSARKGREETYRGIPYSDYEWGDGDGVFNKERTSGISEESSQYRSYLESRKSPQIVSDIANPVSAPGTSKRVGNSGKKFVCMYCGRNFPFYCLLKEHLRRHTGEKPFQCSYCPKRFCYKSHRKRHELIHTGQKPLQCSFCSKRFMDITNKKNHEQTHLRPHSFPCRYCGQVFKNEGCRTNHERAHEQK